MDKRIVKNYKTPGFIIGAALLAATSVGCSKQPSSSVPGATAATSETVKETVKETTSESVNETVKETTSESISETVKEETSIEESVVELEGDVVVEPETEELTLAGEVDIYGGNVLNMTDMYEKEEVSGVSTADKLDKKTLDGLKNFSIDAFKNGVKQAVSENKNAFVSPESLFLALGMTANGATGNTKSQMLNVLCGLEDIQTLNDSLYYFNNAVNTDQSGKLKLSIADSIWLDDYIDFSVSEDFLKTVRSYYDADVFYGALENAVDQVNSWVDNKTNGMIKDLLNEISKDTMMILINTIAFEGQWAEPYEEYDLDDNATFTKEDGTEQKTTLMLSHENAYISDDDTIGFIKYYSGYNYAFVAMLPTEGKTLAEYVNAFSAEKFQSLLDNAQKGSNITVYAKLPKFSYDYSLSYKDILANMGMSDAFDPDLASFDAMGQLTYEKLVISDVIQKTHIDVDSNGTKAAAATAVIMDKCESIMDPEEMKYYEVFLDRPFVYAIVDMSTGIPMFIGTVSDVE